MADQGLCALAEAYLEEEWETVVEDLRTLVRIDSVEDPASAVEGAPFGAGPRKALDAALGIAERMGFETWDVEGYMGVADLRGESEEQIGIIGHLDVVPVGEGWTVPPFDVTRKEGWLIGRGVLDDKGGTVVALHAMNALKRHVATPKRTVRMLFGTNEETGMRDLERYLESNRPPAFLFTPDADFPACYGEKGHASFVLKGDLGDDGAIAEIEGGMALNAVPSMASALVRTDDPSVFAGERVSAVREGDFVRVVASGIGGHAAFPEGTVSAIGVLAETLLESGVCSAREEASLRFAQALASDFKGASVGIDAEDGHFGALTAVGGTISLQDGRIVQTLDVRYPTGVDAAWLTGRLEASGLTVELVEDVEPFLMDVDSSMLRAVCDAYAEATGEAREPFTMGGATYARHFPSAVSFGPNRPWTERPEWAGEEHCADEAVSEETLKTAFRVYVLALAKLTEISL